MLRLISQIFKSRSQIVNIATVVNSVITVLAANDVIAADPELSGILTAISGVVAFILRFDTKTPILEKETLMSSK